MSDAARPAYLEADSARAADPVAALVRCIEEGARGLLLARGALPERFFELASGSAGELVQKAANYGVRLALVVPDLAAQPPRFQEFAREANRGRQLRFVATRAEAVAWLESMRKEG